MSSPISILEAKHPTEFHMGDVLTRTLSVLSRHFLIFLMLVAVVELPNLVIQVLSRSVALEGRSWQTTLLSLAGSIGAITLGSIAQAAVVYATFQDLRGLPVSAGASISKGFRSLFPVIGLSILVGLVVGLGTLLLIVPGLIAMAAFSVATPSCVVEERGPMDSMSRSSHLTSGHRWPIFGVAFALFVVGLIMTLTISRAVPASTQVLRLVAQWGYTTLATAFGAVYATVLYYYLRASAEGIGIDEIAAVFD